jgi:hypothetical protein
VAAPINLNMLDPVDLSQVDWGPDAKRWLTDVVDIINASFTTLNQAFANLLAVGQVNVGGGGAGPLTVTVTDLLSTNFVSVQLVSSSNPVTIASVVAGAGSFAITFSADPGASAIIVYQAFTTQPQ